MTVPILAALAAAFPGGDALQATLAPKVVSKWNYNTPSETWIPIQGGIPLPHEGGDRFLAHVDGVVLMVDRNGDGKVETKVKGLGGFVKLKSGNSVYGVRIMKKGKEYRYSCSSLMTGKLGGVSFSLIDLNGNGKWNDYGVDGLVLGGGKDAGYLSKVVSLNGELYNLDVSENGRDVKATAFEGETGEIDFSVKSKGKLATATLSDESGKVSFAFHKNGKLTVPVGSYAISGGLLQKGKEQARLAAGRMKNVDVAAGKTAELAIGGKVVADFRYEVASGKVTVKPESVHYYGQAGEEYVEWTPDNKSPKLMVFDSKKKRPVESGRFASC